MGLTHDREASLKRLRCETKLGGKRTEFRSFMTIMPRSPRSKSVKLGPMVRPPNLAFQTRTALDENGSYYNLNGTHRRQRHDHAFSNSRNGVTRLLTGLVTIFRIRRTSPVDWVPLAWSGILFSMQLEYWWAINQLPTLRETFQFSEFIFLVLMTLTLFLTAALLLPSRSEDEAQDYRFTSSAMVVSLCCPLLYFYCAGSS